MSGGTPLVRVGRTTGKGAARAPSGTAKTGGKMICGYFNTVKGCGFGGSCQNFNGCYQCQDTRHNIMSCYSLMEEMWKNKSMERFIRRKGFKLEKIYDDDTAPGRGTKRTRANRDTAEPSGRGYNKNNNNNSNGATFFQGPDGKYYKFQ